MLLPVLILRDGRSNRNDGTQELLILICQGTRTRVSGVAAKMEPVVQDPTINTAIKPTLVQADASRFIRMVLTKLACDGSRQTLMAHIIK